MAAYVAGDERAFERLFVRLAPRVHGFFMQSFREPATADDLLQRTFLKLHGARASYRPGAPLRPWLFTIAARVRLDELRSRLHLPDSCDEETLARAAEERGEPARPDGEHADLVARVRAAVDALPEAQRVVVHLHRYEGMSFGEIARVLATSEGAVKQRAFRAYARLRESLASLAGGAKEVA